MNKLHNTLYKKDSKGKIREWSIYTGEEANIPFYSVRHGEKDGALQETKVYVENGKNIGRSNQTTASQQCALEANSLYEKQIERKGYTLEIPTADPYRPMLAHTYADYKHKIEWPAVVSPKLDGVRVIATVTNGNVTLISRTGKEFYGLPHIVKELRSLSDVVIDGELYSDTLSFQEITSVVRKSKSTDTRAKQVYIMAFDLINDQKYHNRVLSLDYIIRNLNFIKSTPWYIVKNESDVDRRHSEFIKYGFEGSMIRNLESYYELNKRSYNLLKKKDFKDGEFEIVGFKTGIGKYANVPTFELKIRDKTFEAVPIGTESERLMYLQAAKALIGKIATVKYFEMTDDGIPRFPVMIGVRDYE